MPIARAGGRDRDLIRRAAAGDREAFGTIYAEYRTVVYRFARLMTGSGTMADDVTQEVFVTLMQTLPQYDAARADLLTYLYGIARNVTRNRLRRERRFLPLDAATDAADSRADDPCTAVSHSQEIARLRRAIRQLPSRYREAIILCDVHGLSYAETARVLDVPVGTVRSRLSRARVRLAAALREDPSGDRRFVPIERCIV